MAILPLANARNNALSRYIYFQAAKRYRFGKRFVECNENEQNMNELMMNIVRIEFRPWSDSAHYEIGTISWHNVRKSIIQWQFNESPYSIR